VCPEIVNGRLVLKCQQPRMTSKNRTAASIKAFHMFVPMTTLGLKSATVSMAA
jgi:hypothetical protein